MGIQINRRALLGSMALAPIAGAAAALPATAPSANGAAWDALFAKAHAAKLASDRFDAEVCNPMMDRLKAVAPDPGRFFTITATNGQTAEFSWRPGDTYEEHLSPAFRSAAADMQRRWEAHAAESIRLDADAIYEHSSDLAEACGDLDWALILMPAPHGDALLWKMKYLWGDHEGDPDASSGSWSQEAVDVVLADARRLLGRDARA